MKRNKNQFQIPKHIRCSPCQKNLITKDQDIHFYPDETIPKNMIFNEDNPSKPMYSIMCPYCGRFYMNKPNLQQ